VFSQRNGDIICCQQTISKITSDWKQRLQQIEEKIDAADSLEFDGLESMVKEENQRMQKLLINHN
jgi:hypothetical protein